jgi:hypothetical protein
MCKVQIGLACLAVLAMACDGGTECTCAEACPKVVPGSGACCGWSGGALSCDACS